MGLDWLPTNKPKPGHEEECLAIVRRLDEPDRHEEKGFLRGLFAGKPAKAFDREELISRFKEISIPAYQTLGAPRVGYDEAANEWALRLREARKSDLPEEEWLRRLHGYYVLDLASPCDGLPRYTNAPLGDVEAYSFRAKFLEDCRDIVGDELIERGYLRLLAPELVEYGRTLVDRATAWASENAVDPDAIEPEREDFDPESPEGKVDIVLSAGRWCIYWGERGHMLDPYF